MAPKPMINVSNTGMKDMLNRVIKVVTMRGGKKSYFIKKKAPNGKGMTKSYNPTAVRRMNGFITPETNHRVPLAIRAKKSHLMRVRK